MESWVTTLLNDVKHKVGFSESSSTNNNTLSSVLPQNTQVEVSPTKHSFDYFPSRLLLPELQLLIQYVLQNRLTDESHNLINVLGRLLFMEHLASENASSAPCLEFDISKAGHACIAASLGKRAWPPEEGYSFVCWFQCKGLKSQQTELQETIKLRLYSVSSTDREESFGEELYLQENGVLTLATNNSSSLSSSSLDLEEGKWYHLAVVQNKRDVAMENFSRIVHIYLNGKLIDNGELASTPTLVERELQITIGTPASHSTVSDLQWRLRSCYLFQDLLSADIINFMYMLARGQQFLLQSPDNSDSIFNEDGGGERLVKLDASSDSGTGMSNSSESIGEIEMLEKIWSQLFGKKLLCAFNATRIEALPASQTLAMLDLVDPMSSAATRTGMPGFGYPYGDVSICRRCIIGNVLSPVSEISVILTLIEAAETSNTLHIALKLFASLLHRNPHSAQQMKACSGYKLLSLFLYRKMPWLDLQCLEILFKIAVSEDPLKLKDSNTVIPSEKAHSQASVMEVNPADFQENFPSEEFDSGIHDSANGDISNHGSEHVANKADALSISGALSDADIVEHVLLNWTLWVITPVSTQLEVLNYFENLITVYKYKDHNISVLRERNIVQLLLAALHRDDVEVVVLEKFVVLVGVILEHSFLEDELESMTTFVLTTFDPPEVAKPLHVITEEKSNRLTLRNLILEMLVDLQVTISSEELLERWHKIVSSKLITFFLDEAVHPTSMIWIITLLGLCLTSSPAFSLKFESSGGYLALTRVLSRFHEFLEIYYTLFCLLFSKPIYPKLPEVVIKDLEELMLNNKDFGDLKYPGLLDSVIAMVKSVFDQLRVQPNLSQQALSISQASDVDLISKENKDIIEELGCEEAPKHKSDAASLLGWESPATNAASILRFMANLAKMSPSFSMIFERTEFLESCVELYFSIMRSYMVEKLMKKPNIATTSTLSSILADDSDNFPSAKSATQLLSIEDSSLVTASHLMLEMDNCSYSGEATSVGATSTLDLISELLSATLIERINPVPTMENLLWSVPLYLDSESVLTFQALCLSRVMIYLERRLLHSDVRNGQSLDTNNLWSNLGSFCNLIVDCVYMGVFPRPSDVLRVLEFCFLMLHSAKKDSQIMESSLPWTGLLSMLRGNKPTDVILKSTNRMIMYCFLPSFSAPIKEDPPSYKEERKVDICIVLELIHSHKETIFHPSNADTDLYCCLCINLISLFSDPKADTRSAAIGILTYLLMHCRTPLEDILISKPDPKNPLDILNGGFDQLLTENMSTFMKWFQSAELVIKHVLQQFAGVRWAGFIAESAKFRKERFGVMEDRWTAKMGEKVEHATQLGLVYWNQYIARRSTLAATRIAACTELELAYGNKSELIVQAESEWRSRQLGHQHKVEPISSLVWEDYWPL